MRFSSKTILLYAEDEGERAYEKLPDVVDVEERVITSVLVRQVMEAQEQIDNEIAILKIRGYNAVEIGKCVGMSDTAVRKRIAKLQGAFRAAGLHD